MSTDLETHIKSLSKISETFPVPWDKSNTLPTTVNIDNPSTNSSPRSPRDTNISPTKSRSPRNSKQNANKNIKEVEAVGNFLASHANMRNLVKFLQKNSNLLKEGGCRYDGMSSPSLLGLSLDLDLSLGLSPLISNPSASYLPSTSIMVLQPIHPVLIFLQKYWDTVVLLMLLASHVVKVWRWQCRGGRVDVNFCCRNNVDMFCCLCSLMSVYVGVYVSVTSLLRMPQQTPNLSRAHFGSEICSTLIYYFGTHPCLELTEKKSFLILG